MKTESNDVGGKLEPDCNVNSTFNFTVGGIAIVAAVLIVFLVYAYWWE